MPITFSATIIVPTYEEAWNIPLLVQAIKEMKNKNSLDLDLLFMDDNSQDGTKEILESIKETWVHYVIRKANRCLSQSVIEGFELAKGDVLVVMDADISHPPDAVPRLLESISNGFDFVIGSRYVPGGSTDESWGLLRKLNSKGATLLAWPLTKVHDPMTGFFAFKRSLLNGIDPLTPTGYKIGLEMLVKSKCKNIAEIPIHFSDRKFGHSKLSFTEQLKFIRHIRRLYIYKYPELSSLLQFLVVGGTGVLVNLSVLTAALALGVPTNFSLLLGILISLILNFLLNRRFSFDYARNGHILKQFLQFTLASSLGAAVNYITAIIVLSLNPGMFVQIAALWGIASGTLVNYFLNRYVVFNKNA